MTWPSWLISTMVSETEAKGVWKRSVLRSKVVEGSEVDLTSLSSVDADGLDANEVSAAAMRAMLAGNMQEYERLNSLMVTKTVVVDETLKGQGVVEGCRDTRGRSGMDRHWEAPGRVGRRCFL